MNGGSVYGGFIVAIFIFIIIGSIFRKDDSMTSHQQRKYEWKLAKRCRKAEMDAWEDQYAMFEVWMDG